MNATFTGIVHEALAKALKENSPEKMAEQLPGLVRDGLRHAGYEVHSKGSCIRLPAPSTLGREFTTDELEATGFGKP